MSLSAQLKNTEALADLRVFVERSLQSTDGVIRFTCGDSTLRVTVCTFSPFGILDSSPTVLGMRIFAEESGATFDAVGSARAILDRIAHLEPGELSIGIPPMRETATWVGVEPPKQDWRQIAEIPAATLNGVALAGIAEVADAVPEQPGEVLVRDVRQKIWGAPFDPMPEMPRSVAFTGHMLGFFTHPSNALIYESGRWMRVSTPSGHVLLYRR